MRFVMRFAMQFYVTICHELYQFAWIIIIITIIIIVIISIIIISINDHLFSKVSMASRRWLQATGR